MSSTEENKRFEKFLAGAKEIENYNEKQALQALQEIGIIGKITNTDKEVFDI